MASGDDEPPLGHITPVDDAEAAIVARLARHILADEASAPTLIGEGANNWVYRIDLPDRSLALKVAKPHKPAWMMAQEHATERWCASAARAVGVPTPAILDTDLFEGRPYQLQVFVPGRPLAEAERARAWAAMGRWARSINAIPVAGWGARLVGDGVFAEDWSAHVAYNIASLTPDDPLRALGVLDATRSADLKRRFEHLAARPIPMGLCHADLAPQNILVDERTSGLTLIDWGCGLAAPVPHHEINEIVRSARASADDLDIFRRAYGLSDSAWAAARAEMPTLGALRDIDTLRWGLDRSPGDVPRLIGYARRALARLDQAPTG